MNNKVFSIVKKYIDEYDYRGLLASGCPPDEFDIESQQISILINDKCSVYEISKVIANTFEAYFNNPEKSKNFLEAARKIKNDLAF